MNILIIRKGLRPHKTTRLSEGRVVETTVERLAEPDVQTSLRGLRFDPVIFADGASWADVSGDVYVFLTSIVPATAVTTRVPALMPRSVL